MVAGLLSVILAAASIGAPKDSVCIQPRLSYEVRYNPGKVLALDEYVKKWLKEDETQSVAIEIHCQPVEWQQAYAEDYNWPTFSLGLRYNRNHNTVMHRDSDPDWGLLEPVDYDTHLGDIVTLYGTFARTLFRSPRWEVDYFLGAGVGYAHHCYNRTDQIDNEFIGSHLNIFFTAGASATWYIARNWGLRGGIDFSHHSNGALYRPNKGANYLGPFIGAVYFPHGHDTQPATSTEARKQDGGAFRRHLYGEVTVGVGAKTLLEDWQQTQFLTPPAAPDYRTDHFHIYMAYSLQTDLLYRYARRWASGGGIDVFYGSYSNHVAALDQQQGFSAQHSPWSVGLAAKHEVFYGPLSVRMGIGWYLFRRMGHSAKEIEKPYYERIGMHYAPPCLHGISIGFNVNAHLTKADFTELQVAVPINKKK